MGLPQVEHEDWQIVLHTQRNRRSIHHTHSQFQSLHIGQLIEALGVRVLVWVLGIDTVHLGGLDQQVGVDLHRPERRGRIGSEIRVARATTDNHRTSLLKVSDRTKTDIWLGNRTHLDSSLHAGDNPHTLQRIGQGESVHHCRQHTHVICRGAVHPMFETIPATPDIACSQNDCDLHLQVAYSRHFGRDLFRHVWANAKPPWAGQ